jgi:uncharacterized protein
MLDSNESEARTWGMLCHLASIIGILLTFVGLPIPFANVLGPLAAWLFKRKEHPFIDAHGKESLNFQISMTIYGIVGVAVLVILVIVYLLFVGASAGATGDPAISLVVIGGLIGAWLLGFVVLLNLVALVLVIMAAVKANAGELYRYPFTIRLIR